jgi:hypothetical protein
MQLHFREVVKIMFSNAVVVRQRQSCLGAYLSTTPQRPILYLTKHRAMKAYGGVEVQLRSFLKPRY